MKKNLILVSIIFLFVLLSCTHPKEPKIGVSIGAGPATRWIKEKEFMESYAKKNVIDLKVVLNTSGSSESQLEDCKNLIDSKIDVLVIMPNDATKVSSIITYAKEKKVKVISYARIIFDSRVDLFVGYDSRRIGKMMGEFLIEKVPHGRYVIFKGDMNDNNSILLHEGSMVKINSIIDKNKDSIQILANVSIEKWSTEVAKESLKKILAENNNHIDAILAPNDKIAGACAEVLKELKIENNVIITGMDAELDAVKRIIKDEQTMTIYLDLKKLAEKAIEQAELLGSGKEAEINSSIEFQSVLIQSNLINGTLIIKQNIDRILINSNFYTKEQVYGEN